MAGRHSETNLGCCQREGYFLHIWHASMQSSRSFWSQDGTETPSDQTRIDVWRLSRWHGTYLDHDEDISRGRVLQATTDNLSTRLRVDLSRVKFNAADGPEKK
jgi:hypothetical protein